MVAKRYFSHKRLAGATMLSFPILCVALCVIRLTVSIDAGPVLDIDRNDLLTPYSIGRPFVTQSWSNNGENAYWDFAGCAVMTENYVRVASQKRLNCPGSLWSLTPFPYTTFRVIMAVRIWSTHNHGEHGVGLWFTKVPQGTQQDRSFFGGAGVFDGVGVIIDTAQYPAAFRVMYSNGKPHTQSRELCGCSYSARNIVKEGSVYVDLEYKDEIFTVQVFADGGFHAQLCCQTVEPVSLPENGYFAVTALNGAEVGLGETVDLTSFKVTSVNPFAEEDRRTVSSLEHHSYDPEKDKQERERFQDASYG